MSVTFRPLDANRLQQRLEARAAADLAAHHIFGAAVLVRQNGAVVYEACFGTTTPNGAPVRPDTVYRLASMTKPITAVAALLLAERGLFALDDPIETYLPQFRDMRVARLDKNDQIVDTVPARTKPTIRHILTHTSGIGSGRCEETHRAGMSAADRASCAAMTDYYARLPLSFEPFTAQEYSGIAAFDVLTAIIEQITNERYDRFLQREIFAPCGMTDTVFVPSDEQKARLIAMHTICDGVSAIGWTEDGCGFETIPCTHCLGGAGLFSTIGDYGRFAEMLRNEGRAGDVQIISPASVHALRTAQVPARLQPGKQRWGLGVRVVTDETYDEGLPVGAYGWSGAYGTHFWVDPINRITAVYMKNSRYDGGDRAITSLHFETDVSSALTV